MKQPVNVRNTLMHVLLIFLPCIFILSSCSSPRVMHQSDPNLVGYSESGKASYYAMKYQSRKTASGELFNQAALTGAHRTLPFGTMVRVTNVKNNRYVKIRINDRGPFVKGRVVDLSRSAFSEIGDLKLGVIDIRLEVVE